MAVQIEALREMCDQNNWGVGTKIRKIPPQGETYDFEITAVGETAVVVKYLSHDIRGELVLYAAEGDQFQEIFDDPHGFDAIKQLDFHLSKATELLKRLGET